MSKQAHGFRIKDQMVLWRCSCDTYHSGTPIREEDWPGAGEHQPMINLETWLPIGSKATVTTRSAWAYGMTFRVLAHYADQWDVRLDCDGDGIGRRCSIVGCVPARLAARMGVREAKP